MMSAQKRGRACVACASIKIRCALGSDTSLQPPCERCVRLNKECTILAPKRQKDRVAELEAQVASLTRLLRAQGIDHPGVAATDALTLVSDVAATTTAAAAPSISKKRRLDTTGPAVSDAGYPSPTPSNLTAAPSGSDDPHPDTFKLDQILSRDLQQHVLSRYLNHVSHSFPLVPLTGDYSLAALRKDRPILLQAVTYAAGMGFLQADVQEDVARLLLNRLADSAIAPGEKSLDLIQAIQITCIWYRAPRSHKSIAVYQLIHLTSALTADLGITGPLMRSSTGFASEAHDLDSTDCWRALLSCYTMSAAMSIFLRRENTTPWSEHHEHGLLFLPSSPIALPSDKWLGQFVRAERVCDQISNILEFSDAYVFHDVSELAMKSKIQTCRNHILNWRVSIPQSVRTPLMQFWEHLAIAYMWEPLLHTPTNKQSFAAPFVSERLSLTDFPAPVVCQDHITAAYELISAAHSMIDIFVAYDTQTLVALSGLFVAARAAYANYLLAKLYIATTIPGNTLGSIVDASILQTEEYNNKLLEAFSRVRAVDARCPTARILGSASRQREWYASYNNNLYSEDGLLNTSAGLRFDSYLPVDGMPPAVSAAVTTQKATDMETFFNFSDSAADFGLDILFSEPLAGFDLLSSMPFGQDVQA